MIYLYVMWPYILLDIIRIKIVLFRVRDNVDIDLNWVYRQRPSVQPGRAIRVQLAQDGMVLVGQVWRATEGCSKADEA